MEMYNSKTASKMKHRSDSAENIKKTFDEETSFWFRLQHLTHCCQLSFQKSILIFATVLFLSQSASADYRGKDLDSFRNSVEDSIRVQGSQTGENAGVSLMWGIPDTTAPLGKLFQYSIPNDAFKGNILKFEITEAGKSTLPQWLYFDDHTQQLHGLPSPLDIGQHYLEVVASDAGPNSAKDVFSVIVNNDMGPTLSNRKLPVPKGMAPVVSCTRGEPQTTVTVIIDGDLDQLASKSRVDMLKRMVSHLNLSSEMVKVLPLGNKPMFDSSALVAGPGDVKSPQYAGVLATWLVGCGRVESEHMPILQKVESSSVDGSLSKAIGHSIVGWHVTNTRFQTKPRKRRQAFRYTPTPSITMETPTRAPSETVFVDVIETDTEAKMTRSVPSMVTPVIQPTKTADMPMKSEMVGPFETVYPEVPIMTKAQPEISLVTPSSTFTMGMTSSPTEILPSKTFVITTESTMVKTKPTETSKPTTRGATEDPIPPTPEAPTPPPLCPKGVDKIKPVLKNPITMLTFKAGDLIRFRIPDDTFYDCKDKSSSNLQLKLFLGRTNLIRKDFWLKFDEERQVIIGMPLESDLGEHQFRLVASNNDGLSEMNSFVILIEGEVESQAVNHEISIKIKEDYEQFMKNLQNRIDLTQKVARLFGDKNPRNMNVLRIEEGSVVYGWTNTSLSTDYCPVAEIHDLVARLITKDGELNQDAVKRLKPYKIVGASAVPHGKCDKHPGFKTVDTTKKVTYVTPTKTKPTTPEPEPTPEVTVEPNDSGESHDTSEDEIWITTVVPAVVIVLILIIALIIACVLYRKKRKGKLSLEDKDTFVNKGVPVIFADELDDKPNDSSKPLIMEEEKPPLPPPQYQRTPSESSRSTPEKNTNGNIEYEEHELEETDVTSPLYQPPPPVTSSGGNKQPRPHVQPAYRNPPPYVPP